MQSSSRNPALAGTNTAKVGDSGCGPVQRRPAQSFALIYSRKPECKRYFRTSTGLQIETLSPLPCYHLQSVALANSRHECRLLFRLAMDQENLLESTGNRLHPGQHLFPVRMAA